MHTCPLVNVLVPHVGGPILPPGALTVLIGGMPAARVTDMCVCVGPPDVIAKGSTGVMIMGMPAARLGDLTAHGGVIVVGFPQVIIGEVGGAAGSAKDVASGDQARLKSKDPKDMKDPEAGGSLTGDKGSPASGGAAAPPSTPAGTPAAPPSVDQANAAALNTSPTAQAAALQDAAAAGTPFVERCPYAH
jgi:uncharacterized Zn-binding protein involved in type VI secretion